MIMGKYHKTSFSGPVSFKEAMVTKLSYNTDYLHLCISFLSFNAKQMIFYQFVFNLLSIILPNKKPMYYSIAQSLWYISQIRIEILKTTCSIFTSLCRLCTSKKQFLISLLQMLLYIHANDYVQFSALSYIINCLGM
jgi:hypothetical protein